MAEPTTGPALRVRIGVNTGEAVAGSAQSAQFLVTGPAVNAAARLQQAAAPGEIVVGELTRRLTAGGVEYGAARELCLQLGIVRLPTIQMYVTAADTPTTTTRSTSSSSRMKKVQDFSCTPKEFQRVQDLTAGYIQQHQHARISSLKLDWMPDAT